MRKPALPPAARLMDAQDERCEMDFRTIVIAGVAVGVFAGVFGSAPAANAQDVFAAKLVRTKGLRKEAVELDLTIREYATQEHADALQAVLDEGGTDALMDALRDGDYGEAKVTGGLTRRVGYVRVFPGENGSTVVIVTDKPLYFPGDEPPGDPAGPVGVFHLQLNDRGRGRGRLAEAVKIDVKPTGTLEVQATASAPIEVEDVVQKQ